MNRSIYFIFTITYCIHANAANQDDITFTPQKSVPPKVTDENMFKDDLINPKTGNLIVKHRDILLPGNGIHNDIEVFRIYNLNEISANLMERSTSSYKWNVGRGWRLKVAPRIYTYNPYWNGTNYRFKNNSGVIMSQLTRLCDSNVASFDTIDYMDAYNVRLDLPDGGDEAFYKKQGNTDAYTKSNWKLSCKAGNITLYSPAGVSYDYGNIDTDLKIGHFITSQPFVFAGGYPLMLPTESVFYMDAKKRSDPNGNKISFEYAAFGDLYKPWNQTNGPDILAVNRPTMLLTNIKSTDGRSLKFNYDPVHGQLTQIIDHMGRSWIYGDYKVDSRLPSSIINDNYQLGKVILPTGLTWEYEYNNKKNSKFSGLTPSYSHGKNEQPKLENEALVSEDKLIKIKYPTGGEVNYEYTYACPSAYLDSVSRYACGEKIKSRILDDGNKWSYIYYRGTPTTYDSTVLTRPDGNIITYKYTGFGYLSPENIKKVSRNNLWKLGLLVEKSDSMGNKEINTWQSREISPSESMAIELNFYSDDKVWAADLSKKIITQNGAIYTTEYQNYDAYGNPGKIMETGPNGENRITNLTYYNDPTKWIIGKPKDDTTYNNSNLVGTTTRTYDDKGNLLSKIKDGIAEINTYDLEGNIASRINANGATTTFSNYKYGIAQTEVQPEGVKVSRIVDNIGNVTAETNGANQTTTYAYDALGRQIVRTPPIGEKTFTNYTPTMKTSSHGDLVETISYDNFGQLKDATKGGIKIIYKHDVFDNKIFESNPGSETLGTSYAYDALNRLKTQKNPDGSTQRYEYGMSSTSIIDERGKIATYNYRSYGNPEEQHLMSITAAEPSTNVILTRNGRDQITSVTQGGLTKSYGYNNKYQLTSVNDPETGITTFGRDNVGNVTSQKVGTSAETTLSYDNRNRNILISYSDGTPSVTKSYTKLDQLDTVSNNLTTRKFNYDANSNLTSEALTVGGINFTTTYQYNSKDQLQSVIYPQSGTVLEYAPDILGRPTKVGDYVTGIKYWPSGQFKQLVYGNGTVSNYGQNTRLWPSQFETTKENQKYLNSSYGYDGVGNLLTITDSVDNSLNRTASYDGINRLSTVQGPWGAGTINYDGVGNITQQSYGSQNLSYNYDSQNRLKSTAGIKTGAYSYDALGNIINDGQNQYHYNALPSLTCINCNDAAKKIEYDYDGLNKRVSVKKEGVTRYEVLNSNGDQLIEYSPDDNKLIEYFYLGGKRVAQKAPPVNMIDSFLPAILSLLLDDDE
jgi:YD repeat-containing protein